MKWFLFPVTALAAILGACDSGEQNQSGDTKENSRFTVISEFETLGSLQFSPGSQAIKVDAGTETVETAITVRNKGAETVTLTRLESGCSCLSVEIDRKILAPGGDAVISGIFSTKKLWGPSEKTITVQTDESLMKKAFIKIRLDVDPLYVIEESMTNWEIDEKPVTKTVSFEVKRVKPIRILKATSMRDEVKCELVELEEGRRYELKLTPASTENPLLGIVKIETDCEIPEHERAMAYFSIQRAK